MIILPKQILLFTSASKKILKPTRLFPKSGWRFLVDAVRVRPFHEAMTTSLLEEVKKRQKHEIPTTCSTTLSHDEAVATTGTTIAANHISDIGGGISATPVTTAIKKGTGGMSNNTTANPTVSAPAVSISLPKNLPSVPSETEELVFVKGGAERGDKVDQLKPGHSPTSMTTAKSEAGQGIKAKNRQAALETIEQHRSRAAAPDIIRIPEEDVSLKVEGRDTSVPSTARVTTATGRTRKSNMSTAFSAESLRWGATLGYYGREEIETLSAISRNPSRVAAYNRIVEGKLDDKGDSVISQVKMRKKAIETEVTWK